MKLPGNSAEIWNHSFLKEKKADIRRFGAIYFD